VKVKVNALRPFKARLTLKVKAGARKTEFAGKSGEAWKLRVAAPPVDGKANREILRFIAGLAQVPAGKARILVGETSSTKIVEVEGIDRTALERAILESHGPAANSGSSAP
jgi:uncharacterized protein (TIGR00251 family)